VIHLLNGLGTVLYVRVGKSFRCGEKNVSCDVLKPNANSSDIQFSCMFFTRRYLTRISLSLFKEKENALNKYVSKTLSEPGLKIH
jgi:hypothetical protein